MTASTAPLWITEADVASLLDLGEAIAALEQGLRLEARGEARNMTKTHVAWQGGTLHAIGASFESTGFVGTKTWANTPRGATPLLVLFDASQGALAAVIEAFALGQLRTSSISGIATARLARRDARTFAIIGTGEQALPQVAAVAATRALASVRVFGRNPERRAAFARRVEEELGLSASSRGSVAEAVEGADIVTLVTRATEPFLSGRSSSPTSWTAATQSRSTASPRSSGCRASSAPISRVASAIGPGSRRSAPLSTRPRRGRRSRTSPCLRRWGWGSPTSPSASTVTGRRSRGGWGEPFSFRSVWRSG